MPHIPKIFLVQMNMKKINLGNTKKSEVIAILDENLDEQLIVFAI